MGHANEKNHTQFPVKLTKNSIVIYKPWRINPSKLQVEKS